jgi:transcriptional regulator with XRE-family HTH domain
MVDPAWFGPRLKQLREAAGLTQPQLAERAGLKKAGIANLEQGRTRPHWDTVVALCQALGVDCNAFMQPPTAPREPAGPGRPTKPEPAEQAPKRSRGRPRKQSAAAEPGQAEAEPNAATPAKGEGRGQGGKKPRRKKGE